MTNADELILQMDDVVGLQLQSTGAPTSDVRASNSGAPEDNRATVVLDAAEVRRALAEESIKEAEAASLAEASVARAAADSSTFAQLKADALEQLEEEKEMMAKREADRMRDVEKSIQAVLVGFSAVLVAVLAAFCPGWMPLDMTSAASGKVAEQVQKV